MQLTDQQIKRFQALYKKHFGEDISREVALEQGIKLVRLMQVIYKPMNKKELDFLNKRRKDTNYKN